MAKEGNGFQLASSLCAKKELVWLCMSTTFSLMSADVWHLRTAMQPRMINVRKRPVRSWSLTRIMMVGGQPRILPSRLSRRRYPFSNVVFWMFKRFLHLIMPQATLHSQVMHYGQSKWTWAAVTDNHKCGLRLTATGLFKKCAFHPHIRHFYMGEPKGLKIVLEESGLWQPGLRLECKDQKNNPCKDGKACCACNVMASQPDFKAQRYLLEELLAEGIHLSIFTQNFIASWTTSRTFG